MRYAHLSRARQAQRELRRERLVQNDRTMRDASFVSTAAAVARAPARAA